MRRSALSALVVACSLAGCVIEQSAPPQPAPTPIPDLVEDRSVYDQDPLEVTTVRLTVTDLTALSAINDNVDGATAPVLFQTDDYAVGETMPNGTIQLRGSSSRESSLHSYKVKLDGDKWRGMNKLNLTKHPYELTRIRNRISYEYMRMLPNFTSLRLQFVHVYLNGEDMGLYENVENPGKGMLADHGLAVSEFYKANDFAFYNFTDEERANWDAADAIIESKGIDSLHHEKLDALLTHINDPRVDTDYLFKRHFNMDNYVTWLALNILLGDFDTANQNFMIYNVPDTDGWYLMPWDYDGDLGFNGPNGQPGTKDRLQSRQGVGTWWLSPLHKRFLEKPENVAILEAKMDELMATVFSDEKTRAIIARIAPVVRPYITSAPDVLHLPGVVQNDAAAGAAAWQAEITRIGDQISRDYQDYYAKRTIPMPIYQAPAVVAGDQILFTWDASYSLPGDPLTYDLDISRTTQFGVNDLVKQVKDLTTTKHSMSSLPPGTYYWRVTVRDKTAGTWQMSNELFSDSTGNYPGIRQLVIP